MDGGLEWKGGREAWDGGREGGREAGDGGRVGLEGREGGRGMEEGLGWKGGRTGREVIKVSFSLVTRSCEAGAVLEGGREGGGRWQ